MVKLDNGRLILLILFDLMCSKNKLIWAFLFLAQRLLK